MQSCTPKLRSVRFKNFSRTSDQLLSSATSIHFIVEGSEGLEVSGITVSTTTSRPTSVPFSQLRRQTASTAAIESGELIHADQQPEQAYRKS